MKMFLKGLKSKQKVEPKNYPFTQWSTFGAHLYRREGEDPTVIFVNKETKKQKVIVDYFGKIHNFPGIVKSDVWTKHFSGKKPILPVIRFRTDFSKLSDEKYIMIWEIQPDGRYWEDDDGFGTENDDEIRLYAFIDKNGDFMGPFKVYNVGNVTYLDRKGETK